VTALVAHAGGGIFVEGTGVHEPPLAADPPTENPVPPPHPLTVVCTLMHAPLATIVVLQDVEQPEAKLIATGPQVEPLGALHVQPHCGVAPEGLRPPWNAGR
jgi:hypothetical protein